MNNLEFSGLAVTLILGYVAWLEYRLWEINAKLNKANLATNEKQNEIDVLNLSDSSLKSELSKDLGSNPNSTKPSSNSSK